MFKLFATKEDKALKSHLGRLIKLAKADGEFHKNEQRLIVKIGKEHGLELEEIEDLMYHTSDYDVEIPESKEERFFQLVDFIELAAEDGHICESENKLFHNLAEQLGFNHTVSGILLEKIERGLESKLSKVEILESSKSLISY